MKDQYCPNCYHPFKGKQNYCGHCGQKNIKGQVTFMDLVRDFITTVFNWDAKFFITPLRLLKPGFLTSEFFKGRRNRYTSPARLLMVSLLIYFAFVMFKSKNEFESLDEKSNMTKVEHVHHFFSDNKDTLQQHLEQRFPNQKITGITDTLDTYILNERGIGKLDFFGNEISSQDMILLTDDEIIEKYKMDSYWEQLIFKRMRKIMHTPGGYIQQVIGRSSWVILLSIPFLSIIMTLLYIRRKRYFVEHVIFLMHINAFIFILGILFFVIGSFINIKGWIIAPYLMGMLYVFPAMKNYYQQGYRKTFIKYILTVISSFYVFGILTLFMFGLGLFLF